MTDAELNVIARALAPVVRDLIANSLAVVNVKLGALEQREARDGRDGLPGMAGQAGERGLQGERGPSGEPGQSGVHGKDGIDGLRGTDGAVGIAGKDGAPGLDGQKGIDGQHGLNGKDGSDGLRGKDGRDGVTLDMKDFVSITSDDDGRTLAFTFTRGEIEVLHAVKTAVVLDRGVYATGKTYDVGDGVTWGGSFWIAKSETSERPGTDAGASSWRLAVKAGRDGKAGPQGPQGQIGPSGRDGSDLTRTDGFGRKA